MNTDVLTHVAAPALETLPGILIDTAQPATPVAPEQYGLSVEDSGAASALCAELIGNRLFEEGLATQPRPREAPAGWRRVASEGARATLALDRDERMHTRRLASLRVTVAPGAGGRAGLASQSRGGVALRAGAVYRLRLCARAAPGFRGDLRVALEDPDGRALAQTTLTCLPTCWSDVCCDLVSAADEPHARLSITTASSGSFWLGMVSLCPAETWRGRPDGLRPDLAEQLQALRPAFLRLPCGCGDADGRWKHTVGDLTRRDPRGAGGLGFHELLQLAEDLGAAPVLRIDSGAGAHDDLGARVQDALDALGYANGPTDEGWGMLRAQHGHPAPFGVRTVEIGSRHDAPDADARCAALRRALTAHFPELEVTAAEWADAPPLAARVR